MSHAPSGFPVTEAQLLLQLLAATCAIAREKEQEGRREGRRHDHRASRLEVDPPQNERDRCLPLLKLGSVLLLEQAP